MEPVMNQEADPITVAFVVGMIVFLFLILLMSEQQPIILINVLPKQVCLTKKEKQTESFKPVKHPEYNVNWA